MKRCIVAILVMAILMLFTACNDPKTNGSSLSSENLPSKIESDINSATHNSSLQSSNITSLPEDTLSSAPTAPALSTDYGAFAGLDRTEQNWGQGVRFNDKNQPEASVIFQNKYEKYDSYFIAPTDDKVLYLTFDEGYENGLTSSILDTLKEKGVSATFFVTGDYVKRNPELVQRMIDEGHAVGNHTWSHPYCGQIPLEKVAEDVQKLQTYVQDNFHYTMKYFRCPYGNFNEQSLAVLQSLGLKTMFWSFAYSDWDTSKQPNPTEALEKITARTHPGAIYLLHAVSQTNADILGDAIDYWKAEGYTLSLL